MRKSAIYILGLIAALGIVSCKTNENNYRAAYQAAVEHRQESSGVDSTIYARIRNQAQESMLAVGTDSIPLRTEYIGYTDGGGASREKVQRYNVVVGQFKQIFNANAMRNRLLASGYSDAMILQTREPLYYVVAATCSTAAEASELFHKIKDDKSLVLRSPLPFVLQPAHFAR
ncbi:MAG: plasminogen receptor (KT) [Barnesiella sp.]|nr:plasminogen receptor (KT) [Bacteroidales bacterium]MBD5250778.1 plasminogen receptor (KT) [Barnesiella sp.]MBD5253961.1 plasminogen receptor (KT) [Barnesiella sp.]